MKNNKFYKLTNIHNDEVIYCLEYIETESNYVINESLYKATAYCKKYPILDVVYYVFRNDIGTISIMGFFLILGKHNFISFEGPINSIFSPLITF